jgi:dTDP-4-dehydrorhamnose reductase
VPKTLVIGHTGRLGSRLYQRLAPCHGLSYPDFDITKKTDTFETIVKLKPEIIINCAAITNVDSCDDDPESAWQVNVIGAKNIAIAARELNAYLIHISSDFVKDPVNEYAWTKLVSEAVVLDGLIVRTTFYDKDFWLFTKLAKGEPVTLYNLAPFQPLAVNTLAEIIIILINKRTRGILEIGCREKVTLYQLGVRFARLIGQTTANINSTEINPYRYPRPMNRSLNLRRLRQNGINIPSLDDDLKQFITHELKLRLSYG